MQQDVFLDFHKQSALTSALLQTKANIPFIVSTTNDDQASYKSLPNKNYLNWKDQQWLSSILWQRKLVCKFLKTLFIINTWQFLHWSYKSFQLQKHNK